MFSTEFQLCLRVALIDGKSEANEARGDRCQVFDDSVDNRDCMP